MKLKVAPVRDIIVLARIVGRTAEAGVKWALRGRVSPPITQLDLLHMRAYFRM